jgi:uncharacterized protein (DUF58 family)
MTTIQSPTGAQPFYTQLFDAEFMRKLERLTLVSRKLKAGQLKGERRSPKRGQSVEFADYRNYTPGDDLRRVDWNAYARMERLFIKLFRRKKTSPYTSSSTPASQWTGATPTTSPSPRPSRP